MYILVFFKSEMGPCFLFKGRHRIDKNVELGLFKIRNGARSRVSCFCRVYTGTREQRPSKLQIREINAFVASFKRFGLFIYSPVLKIDIKIFGSFYLHSTKVWNIQVFENYFLFGALLGMGAVSCLSTVRKDKISCFWPL